MLSNERRLNRNSVKSDIKVSSENFMRNIWRSLDAMTANRSRNTTKYIDEIFVCYSFIKLLKNNLMNFV